MKASSLGGVSKATDMAGMLETKSCNRCGSSPVVESVSTALSQCGVEP